MASGDTKTEQMLNVLANGGDASQFSGCCNTKTQNYILGAIDRVQSVEDEVEELKNNPDVVDIVDTYADLQAYDTQHLTENDIIRVLQDETHSGNSTYYRFTKNPDTWTFIGEISGGGGGDSVYSTVTTSNSTTGGAVYIGNLSTDQQAVQDPSATDNHYKYFWALPYSNNGATYGKPGQSSVNIMGTANGVGSVSIGMESGNYNVGYSVAVGAYAGAGPSGVSIGYNSGTSQDFTGNVCIGDDAKITQSGVRDSVCLGRKARATRIGEVNVGTGSSTIGYNGTSYRVIGGVHDPVDAHDAATKGYVDSQGGGGGDSVYSSKTTSNSATDGAVYIGNLNASQDEQPDPTATDNHYKYFWALPNNNASVPRDKSVNILGGPASKYSVVLGYGAKDSSLDSAQRNVVIGNNASLASNATSYCVGIGPGAQCNDDFGVAIGSSANAQGTYSVSIGRNAEPSVNKNYTVNLGAYASATRTGEVNVGSGAQNYGYNGTSYRVIGGVHDGQLANDATTVGQINALIDAINTALSTNIPHIGANS